MSVFPAQRALLNLQKNQLNAVSCYVVLQQYPNKTYKPHEQLEDYYQLDEFAALDKAWGVVKKIAGGAKRAFNWLKRVLWALLDKVKAAMTKIRKLGERALEAVTNFLLS